MLQIRNNELKETMKVIEEERREERQQLERVDRKRVWREEFKKEMVELKNENRMLKDGVKRRKE